MVNANGQLERHLATIYRKLGITGRGQLRESLVSAAGD